MVRSIKAAVAVSLCHLLRLSITTITIYLNTMAMPYPALMFPPFTLPVTYHHGPHSGYGLPLFSHCQAGSSIYSPTYYPRPIPRYMSLQPLSSKKDTDDSHVFLTDVKLWKLFDNAKNEMVVTKPGR